MKEADDDGHDGDRLMLDVLAHHLRVAGVEDGRGRRSDGMALE